MGWKRTILETARRSGALGAVARFYGRDRLTVLAYHRIIDHTTPRFASFAGNVSASPAEFADQMHWVSENFSVVALTDVVAAIAGAPLPDRPLLITFDDGYRDNLDNALPVLRRLGLPGLMFVATTHIRTEEPFWWDRVAAAFVESGPGEADLPILGPAHWAGDGAQTIAARWIAAAKLLSDDEMRAAVDALATVLGSSGQSASGTVLGWDGVRALAAHGVAIGGHTRTHPILTRVPAARARDEIAGSKDDVEQELGAPALGFAYPNGRPGDLDDAVVSAVGRAGYRAAFTLSPGPLRRRELEREPLRVRRVYVHHGDGIDRFAAKVAGIPRLSGILQ